MTHRENEVLTQAVKILKKYLNPTKIFLFGSRAKGKVVGNPDFDLAVDCPLPHHSKQTQISEEIEAVIGLYQVDIIYLAEVDSEFKEIILKTGKVVYEK